MTGFVIEARERDTRRIVTFPATCYPAARAKAQNLTAPSGPYQSMVICAGRHGAHVLDRFLRAEDGTWCHVHNPAYPMEP